MTTTTHSTTSASSRTHRANTLWPGCMLGEYRIDSILGAGGFGVTYKAWDTHLETWVAIKEYFPVEWSFRDPDGVTVHPNTQGDAHNTERQISDYLWGLERFLDEARALARIQHPYVVRVRRYFQAHGTACIVMDYEEGEPLSAILRSDETLNEDEVRGLLEDVLPALQAVHEQGYLHRDIKPANLYVRASDHRVILIDFGAARTAVGRHSNSVTSLVTPGYSPPEQYTTRNDRYGAWTDIYALGAVLYRCVTGQSPVEAAERLLEDNLEPAVRAGAGCYSANLLRVIDRALAVRPERRFQTVADMRTALSGSWDEDGDEAAMPVSPVKSGGKPVREPDMLHRNELSKRLLTEPVTEGGQSPEIAPSPGANRQPADRRLNDAVWSSSNAELSRRWPSGALVGGGLGLTALTAAAVVWLWPVTPAPEERPPPRYSLDQRAQSTATIITRRAGPSVWPYSPDQRAQPTAPADASSPIPAGPPVPVATPPAVPTPDSPAGAPPVAMEPAAALSVSITEPPAPNESLVAEAMTRGSLPATESGMPAQSAEADLEPRSPPESGALTVQLIPPRTPAAGSSPEPAVGAAGILAPDSAATANAQAGSAARPATTEPVVDKNRPQQRDVAPARTRNSGQQAGRASSQSRAANPRRAVRFWRGWKRVVRNPWEPPASTGFNQK